MEKESIHIESNKTTKNSECEWQEHLPTEPFSLIVFGDVFFKLTARYGTNEPSSN